MSETQTSNFQKLSKELQERIEEDVRTGKRPDFSCKNESVIRRKYMKQTLLRPAFVIDVDKITNSAYYNRYTDKTQVFSFYKNDDISRRSYHVQLVSRIARSIGQVLGLNLDLIEAIALGHDIGHTPFGHKGEERLNDIYYSNTGRFFNHNVHSVRILDQIIPYNISLQTLSGIISHNGEMELQEYWPSKLDSFEEFDILVEKAYTDKETIKKLRPSTLEGCVVRVCDIIAYLGKDRQDAYKVGLHFPETAFDQVFGKKNSEIINNIMVNIIENSYGKNYIMMDGEYKKQLTDAKKQNNEYIYQHSAVKNKYDVIQPMMKSMYEKLFSDLKSGNKNSVIFKHHIDFVNKVTKNFQRSKPYNDEEPNQIVVDFIASMTDDYFIDLHEYLFPDSPYKVEYISYFENLKSETN